jgi:predicted ATP-dependent endonuclease of OLD family
MHLNVMRIKNFRRLKNVVIDLDNDISIFVGANNSGKTSVAEALQLFLSASREKFVLHDLSAAEWPEIERFANEEEGAALPEISVDLWFGVEAVDLHRVIDLLPSLSWQGKHVGIRITFSPTEAEATLTRFRLTQARALAAMDGAAGTDGGEAEFMPRPKTLTEFLTDELRREYEFRYYVLDRSKFDDNFHEIHNHEPLEILPDKGRTGKDIVNSLVRFDFLQAQRHLSDTSGGSRSEDLSRHLSRFYRRNLEKHADDYKAIRALSESETLLDKHLEKVFASTLERLAVLGYPGLSNPRLTIKSALNPATLMSSHDGAQVHYALDDSLTLPEKYNGLGFKNLIYMVVELLDLHNQWMDIVDKRPPLHLVFIEEPESHLHTQLQQVFVKKILDILAIDGDDAQFHASQIVLTTHSPHILYERGFRPIRYFRREHVGAQQSTTVLNLSYFYAKTQNPTRDFLERYLKLTHCDLFFADAAILVEGNVERLLMPQMIERAAPELKSAYLCTLEIGGAFGHRFQTLIEFLGITALIVTDLDSVMGLPDRDGKDGSVDDQAAGEEEKDKAEIDEHEDVDEVEDSRPKPGSTCRVETQHAISSNQTLIQWLPREKRIENLLTATEQQKTQTRSAECPATIRVCYQKSVTITREGDTLVLAGRTLEEAFAYENFDWCQDMANKELKLRVKSSDTPTLAIMTERLHKRIHGKNFNKTDFALALLSKDKDDWIVPTYIREGLEWLQSVMLMPAAHVAADNNDLPI